jgi:hypothetical protein
MTLIGRVKQLLAQQNKMAGQILVSIHQTLTLVSDHETPRSGFGNVGESLDEPFTTESKHPSELAESLCQIDPSAAGC